MHDIFISYSNDDNKVMLEICRQFEAAGLKCWYDKRNIPLGDSWRGAITEAIEASKIFIIIYSENSNNSDEVLKEVLLAERSKRVVIPFCISDCKMNPDLAYSLNTKQWHNAVSVPLEEGVASLVERVKALLEIESPEAEVPEKEEAENESVVVEDGKIEYEDIEDGLEELDQEEKKQKLINTILTIVQIVCIITMVVCAIWWFVEYKKSSHPRINMENLSSFDEYIYPYDEFNMFSSKYNMFFAKEKETGKISFIDTSDRDVLFTLLEDKFDETNTKLVYDEDSKYAYFIDRNKHTVRICNLEKGVWVGGEIKLELSNTEYIESYACNTYTGLDANLSETLDIFVFDHAKDKQCYSKILRVFSTVDVVSEFDISEYRLKDYLCSSADDYDFWLMWNVNDRVKVFDFNTMSVPELTYEELKKDYFPHLSVKGGNISPDGKYVCRTVEMMGGVPNITVWNLETGEQLFKKTLSYDGAAFFTKDNTLVYYDSRDFSMLEYNPATKENRVILDGEYFLKEYKDLYSVPMQFYYDCELDVCFMLCVELDDDEESWHLVAFRRDGEVLGLSDTMEVVPDFMEKGDVSADDVFISGENIFVMVKAIPEYDGEINTVIYRGKYQKTKDGKIEFLYY